MNKLKNHSGVTLIEILIGIVISIIIMGAMYASYTAINNSYSQVTDKAKASQTGRNIMGMMMRDIRQAGFRVFEDNILNDDEPINVTPGRGGPDATIVSDCDHIRIVYGDASLDGNGDEEYTRYRVTYFCRDSDLLDPNGVVENTNAIYKQKEELINGGWVSNTNNSYPEQLITDYVDDLIFIVKDVNGEAIDPPPQNDAGNANRLRVDDIRAVEIALTTRSRKNFYKNTTTNDGSNRRVFEIDSEEVDPLGDGTEFTDRFLRETVVLSVNTRNIGLE